MPPEPEAKHVQEDDRKQQRERKDFKANLAKTLRAIAWHERDPLTEQERQMLLERATVLGGDLVDRVTRGLRWALILRGVAARKN